MSFEQSYLQLLRFVRDSGEDRPSRAGETRSVFGGALRIESLTKGEFPILTTRQIFYKPVLGELAAFLEGATTLEQYKAHGCNYWDANAEAWAMNEGLPVEEMVVGRNYGVQWRDWDYEIDQLRNLVNGIIADPYGRRHIVTAWHPSELDMSCLPPCHILFQASVRRGTQLDLGVYMRSVDLCVGLPADIVLYATLLLLLAQETGYKPGNLTFFFGDMHIYANHLGLLNEQMSRLPQLLPTFTLDKTATIDNFVPSHLVLHDYEHAERINYAFNV